MKQRRPSVSNPRTERAGTCSTASEVLRSEASADAVERGPTSGSLGGRRPEIPKPLNSTRAGQRPRFLRTFFRPDFAAIFLAVQLPILGFPVLGDEYVVANWQVEQGLPQNTVKEIIQTQDGYLWLGTFNGLARFDGLKFRTFNTANTPAMRSEDITALFEDAAGRLWVGTEYGLISYEKGQFLPCPEPARLRNAHVMNFQELRDGTLFVATDQGLFQRVNGTFLEIPIPNASWPTRMSRIALDRAGHLLAAHRSKIYVWKNRQFQWQTEFPADIVFLSCDRDGTLWCGLADSKLIKLTSQTAQEYSSLHGVKKRTVFQTRIGDLWIASNQGLYRDRQGNLLHLSKQNLLPSDDIARVYEDREGNIWVGTADHGLVRLRQKLVESYSVRNGLNSDDAIAILEDRDGRVWLGTFEGALNVFENGRWSPVKPPGLPASVQHIISLRQASDGALWLGSYGQGAFRWQGNEVQPKSNSKEAVARVIFEDRDGGFWIGSNKSGVEHLKGDVMTHYNTDNGLSLNYVTAIAQDKSGAVWIGTEYGLNRVANGTVARFFKENGLGANPINALFADQAGILWIGTLGGGLTRYKDGHFTTITTAQGLSQDVVTQIIEDDDGNLWMGSRMGIFRARKADLNNVMDGRGSMVFCMSYTKADGLLNLSCVGGFQPTCMKARDGRLWFCGPGGVTVIDPKRMNRNQTPPPMYIEAVIGDGETLTGAEQRAEGRKAAPEVTKTSQVSLSDAVQRRAEVPLQAQPGARRLEFQYTGLNFSAPEQLQFRCKLEGYDEDWQYVGTRRAAYYTRVPPGRYQFRVAALGETAQQSETSIVLIVPPYFYQTLWFRGLLLVLVVAALGSIYRLRIRHLREVEALRWRMAADLHDELGSNLSNIALLAHLGSLPESSPTGPSPELVEINQVAIETTHAVRDMVWFITPGCDTLEKLAHQMEAIVARSDSQVTVEFKSNLMSKDRKLSLSFRRNLMILFKETLQNALKHAKAHRVQILVTEEKNILNLSIKDDGVGYDTASVTGGRGLANMRQRAEELGASINMHSAPGQGTEVRLGVRLG